MPMVYGTNTELLGTWSDMNEFGSSFIVRTRRTNNGEKLLVDITEAFSHLTANFFYQQKLACRAARRYGATSTDHSVLGGHTHSKKVSDASGTMHTVNVTRYTFVFSAVK